MDLPRERAVECRENGYLLSAKEIGTGAYSKVFLGYATPDKISQNYKLARDLKSKNHNMVAIKIISLSQAPRGYSKKLLDREIYALNATYRHTGVVQLYDTFRSPTRFYLILELVLRGDLLRHINAESRSKGRPGISEQDARKIFKQIIYAVMHCHNNHIVHRDLKCENILLDERGFVKLTDFGIAKHYIGRSSMMNTFCGSVSYTAPEILLCRKYSGEQADLWSLGVILYAMVMGKLPYHEKHPRKLVQLIQKELPFHQPISSGCQDLICQLLQWQPSARISLLQITTHPWMTLTLTGMYQPFKLHPTESDIAEKEPIGFVVGRSCHSGSGTGPSFGRSPTSLPGGPHRTSVAPQPHYRPGASSANCTHREPGQQRADPHSPKPRSVTPCRLLTRPTQNQSADPNRLFVTWPRPPTVPKPRPPSTIKPFHNSLNLKLPGLATKDQQPHRRLRSLSGKPADSGPPRQRRMMCDFNTSRISC
ncbi:hypothetical protein DPEC_G00286920 [Dallia pectoralis]|uniref:Uncharacterized protein n=1 Tax=Dallia pectoralis TaxID=75939 RepID=A0ACC2FK25_DALPE|nr:hypothetical protein DPEC_G00286920 [Dallia pectoralis]